MSGEDVFGSPSPAQTPLATAAAPAEKSVDGLALEGPAKDYLSKLLKNIATMLSYATANGIVLPDDLRGKIDELLKNPEVTKSSLPLFFKN